ncbi:probable ribosome production factor 1 [Neocloeon triangulifer]|uniref:probable ribosome production factor 1 n=1 Tax=Neocloeon triangulifer TaxID=2078957 RepID=UPI00286EBAE0|nr:probable ribosome production factor 1 [Neocloeon triangulifer]
MAKFKREKVRAKPAKERGDPKTSGDSSGAVEGDEGAVPAMPDFSIPQYVNDIRNKILRREMVQKLRRKATKEKKKIKAERKKMGVEKGVPKTIESMREKDETTVDEANEEQMEEVELDLQTDELSKYFEHTYEPKVLVTYSDNTNKRSVQFGRELCRIIPNAHSYFRKRAAVKKIIESCKKEGNYTDIVVINEDMGKPNGLLLIHLPEGPTAHFRLSNVKLSKKMHIKVDKREFTDHRPEVILNNFTTRLGYTVSRMLAAIFHYDPDYKGRRAVTFHNQRDYIFFRHHRYEFKNQEKVKLRELGPRFTLKLRSLQQGTFDSKFGDYEWMITGRRHEMETSRRRFFL